MGISFVGEQSLPGPDKGEGCARETLGTELEEDLEPVTTPGLTHRSRELRVIKTH